MEELFQIEDGIDVDTYLEFRRMVNWALFPKDEAITCLNNSAIKITCKLEDEAVGITRVVWDHGYTAYLADVIVKEEYRGQGIGKLLVQTVLDKLRNSLKPGWKCRVILVAAKGKEEFYKQFGFVERPNKNEGAGMNVILEQ